MQPKPWSYSSFKTFVTCPRKYHAEQVTKEVPYKDSPQTIYGKRVHKDFEDFQALGTTLPPDVDRHLPFMEKLRDEGTNLRVERKVALDQQLKPCAFFSKDVWWRGVVDYQKTLTPIRERIVDYKTGKVKPDMRQLHLFAFYTFVEMPHVEEVELSYYWTQTAQQFPVPIILHRSQMWRIIQSFVPDLNQYKEAFATDIWQPRPSGLCKEWCGVKDCEFYGVGGGRR